MGRGLINKYIWIIDTLQRYGRITRNELGRLWIESDVSGGEPLARRTFYNYRDGIADVFNVDIECDPATFEYYIKDTGEQAGKLRNLLLDTASMTGMLSDAGAVSRRIVLEEVPSSRTNLPVMIQAMKQNRRVQFTYHSYTRVNPTPGVVIEPYFVRLFKQLWYVVGYNVKDRKIKTYSLDRMADAVIRSEEFAMPADFDAEGFFHDNFGIMTSRGVAKDVVLRVSSNQAKYLRALPLHHSQRETAIHDDYSLFHYHLYLTFDFIKELLSLGSSVTVVKPPELKAQLLDELRRTLSLYD
ncbi:MAG: WYL domain-containing protein [Bacteroidales bacterium]|nr:WYL domain-containing protein [Bacteroidales bacterium]